MAAYQGFSQPALNFKSLRYDENYAYLQRDTAKSWYTRMKFTPLCRNGNTYISYGGDIRFQYFYARNEGWGDEPADDDGYILMRWLLHTDFHAGEHFRTFVQLQSSVAGSRPTASPVDDNPLELHQAFIDLADTMAAVPVILRFGRQELSYGSQRLVSTRENPNNRQSFDALRVILQPPHYRADFFYSYYVAANVKLFDDGINSDTRLWGVYITRNRLSVPGNIDLYYLGLWKAHSVFDDGAGKELRHSVGTRIWCTKGSWTYDAETLYQFGRFAGKRISAWTASLNMAYTFVSLPLKPEVGVKTEVISGDKVHHDNKLQTFNPLFPRGAYFGLAALIGPANLIDVHPNITLNLSERTEVAVDYDVFWRYSITDGLYAVNVSLIYPATSSKEKHIGDQLSCALTYRPNEFLHFRGECTWFRAAGYLKFAGAGKDILFTGITAQLKF